MRKIYENYQEWYDHIAAIAKNKGPFLLSLLRAFNRFMTVVMPMIYLTLLAINLSPRKDLGEQDLYLTCLSLRQVL